MGEKVWVQEEADMIDPSPRLTGLLDEVVKHKAVLTGREVVDISAGTRGIMLGIIDETVSCGIWARKRVERADLGRWVELRVGDLVWTKLSVGTPHYQLQDVS